VAKGYHWAVAPRRHRDRLLGPMVFGLSGCNRSAHGPQPVATAPSERGSSAGFWGGSTPAPLCTRACSPARKRQARCDPTRPQSARCQPAGERARSRLATMSPRRRWPGSMSRGLKPRIFASPRKTSRGVAENTSYSRVALNTTVMSAQCPKKAPSCLKHRSDHSASFYEREDPIRVRQISRSSAAFARAYLAARLA
jgi:hypothetical protein